MSTHEERVTAIEARCKAIVDVVFDAFMNGEDGIPVRVIAERVGCTAPQVNSGCSHECDVAGWTRITPVEVTVPVHERNYNTVTHHRRCRGYAVSRAYLRNKINEAKS